MDETWKHYRKWWKGQSQQPHTVPFHLHVVHREGSRKEAAKGAGQNLSLLVWVTTDVCAQGWEAEISGDKIYLQFTAIHSEWWIKWYVYSPLIKMLFV